MLNAALCEELIAMRDEDLRVRQELLESGELGGSYVPRMEAVHIKNAERLGAIIDEYGWPDGELVGEDGAKAAWFIAQHAIGFPDFQRKCLALLQRSADQGRVPRWHAAYLEDRIAMHEGRPQRYGTQWLDDPVDGRIRPWKLGDPEQVNDLRAEVGLEAMLPIPERGPELSLEEQEAIYENQRWWEEWLISKGWREEAPAMHDHLRISCASYDDLPEVAQIHVASWKQTYVGQVPQAYLDNLDVARRLRLWQEQFPNRDISDLLIAKVNNTAAGFVCFGCARDKDRQDCGEIYAIYVLKEHLGRGIGYGLHKSACAELRDKGLERVYLWVLDTNHQAISAYKRWGGVVERDRIKDHVIGNQPVKEISVLFNLT
jgi:GNAT superfamily N-acetyltransferase